MKIVYGVSGEGLGHVFEAVEIAAVLRQAGHELLVLTYGERAMEVLRHLQPMRIEGLPLYFGPKGLSLAKTIRKNAHVIPFYVRHGSRLHGDIAAFGPDVFLTAYEPFTALAARRLRRPLISMDNQCALLHRPVRLPGHRIAQTVATLATRLVTAGTVAYLVKSFDPPPSLSPRVRFTAPIIQREIRELQPATGNDILIYLTKPNPQLLQTLRSLPHSFAVYDDSPIRCDGNLRFGARGPQFLADLAACRAVIGTAGFSLIADAIHLRKPYFAVPLKRQFEQTLNAHFLREAGLGDADENPSQARIAQFLRQAPEFAARLARRPSRPAEQGEALLDLLQQVRVPSRTRSAGGAGRGSYWPETGRTR